MLQTSEVEEPTKRATKRRRRSLGRSVDDEVWDDVWELDAIPDRLRLRFVPRFVVNASSQDFVETILGHGGRKDAAGGATEGLLQGALSSAHLAEFG